MLPGRGLTLAALGQRDMAARVLARQRSVSPARRLTDDRSDYGDVELVPKRIAHQVGGEVDV